MRTAPVHKPQDPATIQAGLLALLVVLDGAPAGSPAAGAFIAALRRRGEDLAHIEDVEALREARTAAVAASPDHAAVIDAAWSTIREWTV